MKPKGVREPSQASPLTWSVPPHTLFSTCAGWGGARGGGHFATLTGTRAHRHAPSCAPSIHSPDSKLAAPASESTRPAFPGTSHRFLSVTGPQPSLPTLSGCPGPARVTPLSAPPSHHECTFRLFN